MLGSLKNVKNNFKESLLSRITNYCLSSKSFQSSDSILCKIIITGNMKSLNTLEKFTRVFDNSKWTDSTIAGPTTTDLKSFLISIYKPIVKLFAFSIFVLFSVFDEYYALGFFRLHLKELLWFIFTTISSLSWYVTTRFTVHNTQNTFPVSNNISKTNDSIVRYSSASNSITQGTVSGLKSALYTKEIFKSTIPTLKTSTIYNDLTFNQQLINYSYAPLLYKPLLIPSDNTQVNVDRSYWRDCEHLHKYTTLNKLTLQSTLTSFNDFTSLMLQESNLKFQNDLNKEAVWIKKNSQLTPSISRSIVTYSQILNHLGDSTSRSNAINSKYWYSLNTPSSNVILGDSNSKSSNSVEMNNTLILKNPYLSNLLLRSTLPSSLKYQASRYNLFGLSTLTMYDTQPLNTNFSNSTINKNSSNYIVDEIISRNLPTNLTFTNLSLLNSNNKLGLKMVEANQDLITYESLINQELFTHTNLELLTKVLSSSSNSLSINLYKNYDFGVPSTYTDYTSIKL